MNPRVGDGFIRLDAAGDVEYASPNALSAYRRLGLIGDLVDEHLPTADRRAASPPSEGPVDDSVRSVLSGRASRRAELVSGDAHLMLRVIPLRRRTRCASGAIVLLPRRQRPAQQGAPAGHQGRDDPRDPPPGEEQPADRRRAAADAGAADDVATRPGSRSRTPRRGWPRSRSCTRRCRRPSTRSSTSTRSPTACCGWWATCRRAGAGCRRGARAASARCRPTSPPAWPWW